MEAFVTYWQLLLLYHFGRSLIPFGKYIASLLITFVSVYPGGHDVIRALEWSYVCWSIPKSTLMYIHAQVYYDCWCDLLKNTEGSLIFVECNIFSKFSCDLESIKTIACV